MSKKDKLDWSLNSKKIQEEWIQGYSDVRFQNKSPEISAGFDG